jgi:hypothetical protein
MCPFLFLSSRVTAIVLGMKYPPSIQDTCADGWAKGYSEDKGSEQRPGPDHSMFFSLSTLDI